ncbi:DUF1799 domain-containing protein [uncultured Azohydromonas sp.]|uniref:DUF1799 domain-containing protein n=1 Tax=uncultured Azohydromonas sp. TaxID=487342 RepID=UPI00263836A2|nr:DUF1799 domain-containing protein [uncultured Azohydromonas sp.]
MAAAGAAPHLVAHARGSPLERPGLEVFPDCWDAVQVFLLLGRQWRIEVAPNGKLIRHGLDLAALPGVIDAYGVPQPERRALIADLRLMEEAALEVLNAHLDQP